VLEYNEPSARAIIPVKPYFSLEVRFPRSEEREREREREGEGEVERESSTFS